VYSVNDSGIVHDCLAGVPRNKAEATKLYNEAAGKGSTVAMERLKALQRCQPRLKSTSSGMYLHV